MLSPMTIDPVLPLQALLGTWNADTSANDDENWLFQARAACAETLTRIETLRESPAAADRDVQVCLTAVIKSLQWVLADQPSANEMSVTVRRAVQVFDRISHTAS